ncbi:MAG: circadian clock KaiB family protein [Bacteroidia bacterium]
MKAKTDKEIYVLHLFIAGITPNATRAIVNIKTICSKYLAGRFELRVIDIYQQPKLLITEQITAVPTLIRKYPLPEKIMIGDLSNFGQVLKDLDLKEKVKIKELW